MKSVQKSIVKSVLGACLLVPMCMTAQVPNIDAPNQTNFQAQTHFLTFLGSFKQESPTTATAYYAAIDPYNQKVTFQQWLVSAGFIANEGQWHPTGKQIIACDLGVAAGCDLPAHNPDNSLVYGDNIINTGSHVIVLNAADLGFVRNQFIRCFPSCNAKNPIIYTYLENYPVFPYTKGGTNFGNPDGTGAGFPSQAEANAAIQSAITRPSTAGLERIADVAFDWAPPVTNPTSSTRFGKQFAYIFHDVGGNITETRNWPNDPTFIDGLNHRTDFPPLFPVVAGQPFAPDLDFRGFKQMPGLCSICHGGKPQTLTSTGAFPNGGNIGGFRFLPLDAENLMFATDPSDPLSRPRQEAAMKYYNQQVLLTVSKSKENDGTGTYRGAHLAEVIKGWYAGFPGDQNMTGTTQDDQFVPTGWVGHEDLYHNTVVTACRSCHFNREISLDFGTYANFKQESDMLQLTLLPQCDNSHPDPKLRPMPAAHLTYVRYWSNRTDPNSNRPAQDLPGFIAQNFGFASTAGYCASKP